MLLKTRFYLPPLRRGAILRDSLLRLLQDSAGGSLVLVTAPAGYGKTTLVSQWLHLHPQTFAWLTLDAEHNVMGVFWQYLLTALQQMAPELGRDAEQQALTMTTPDYRQLLVSLLNDLDQYSINNRARDPLTLVLDDFHVLNNPRLLQLINVLLDHLPACIRIVVTARSEPELQLARRRASGQLLQLGIQDLRFSLAEARAFFAASTDQIPDPQWADTWCARAEGWVAALQLAALSLRHPPADLQVQAQTPALDRHIADYLLDEVFATLPGHLQQFLLHTALVKRFCAALGNAIDTRNDSYALLVELENLNLFLVPLDNHRTWYRYHDLFRQFLLQRGQQVGMTLHDGAINRALTWQELNGYWEDAIETALEWQQWAEAVRLLQQDNLRALADTGKDKWRQWWQRIPAEWHPVSPVMPSIQGLPEDALDTTSTRAIDTLIEPLTRQEQNVLQLIGQGLPNKTIARQLQISLNTLKVHIRNLYGKMGVENRTQALLRLRADDRQL